MGLATLDQRLKAAGLPIEGVSPGTPPTVNGWSVDPTSDQVSQATALCAAFDGPLEDVRQQKLSSITVQADVLRLQGFSFKGHLFALDPASCLNWTGLFNAKDFIAYPISLIAQDRQVVSLTNSVDVMTFYVTGFGIVQQIVTKAAELTTDAMNATTIQDLNLIVVPW